MYQFLNFCVILFFLHNCLVNFYNKILTLVSNYWQISYLIHFISLCRKYKPKRFVNNGIPRPKYVEFEVSEAFAETIIGWKRATREYCSKKLYCYILNKNLFVQNGKKFFVPDEFLSLTLGTSQINVHKGINLFLNANLKKIEKK